MLKKKKKNILKHKFLLLNYNNYLNYQINFFLKKNNFVPQKSRINLLLKQNFSKKQLICLKSGKYKAINSYLKLNRSVVNSFVQFNYFPNLKVFGQ